MAFSYCAASLTGFVTDATLLQIALTAGLEPAWARLGSLLCAMQVTFLINGLRVFGGLDRSRLARQWAAYMVTNGFGNFCNYWIFVTLVSLHMEIASAPMFALTVGAVCAWTINYAATRFIVFRKPRSGARRRATTAAFRATAPAPASRAVPRR